MGRVNPQSPAPAPAPAVTHFTHPHSLHLITLPNSSSALCSGCNLPSTTATAAATMYVCLPCNFSLHPSCAALPRHITHPSHVGCTLSLFTSSAYNQSTTTAFVCDACTHPGSGWSYHCQRCNYDLHVTCASKPMKGRHVSHGTCVLDLTFKGPYGEHDGFSCDVCGRVGKKKEWLYRCDPCGFDVHLECMASRGRPQVLQHHNSMPAMPVVTTTPVYHQNQQQLVHSQSVPLGVNNTTSVYGGPGVGNMQARPSLGQNLMFAAMEGFVEGAFQEVGQFAAQSVLGTGGDGGGGVVDFSGGFGLDVSGGGGGDQSAC